VDAARIMIAISRYGRKRSSANDERHQIGIVGGFILEWWASGKQAVQMFYDCAV
jgi:hypothetical protein